ncbi:hypothetical protein FHS57_004796 [Runella defluvii]|uniref:Lipoprotein n=1 Tax=Runella defluvii TaxID=370973 RepID=A0A7W5ZRL7_9BACT|nr:hypothetical protein [Runella defluvii]MBB3840776.1 hypothetical protein [Runella defluvii]
MKKVVFFAVVLFISSCAELHQKQSPKGDTTKVLNVVKSIHFKSLKESSFGKVDLSENDSTIEANYLPSNFDVTIDSLERQFGTYTVYKKQVYFADLNGDDMIDALVEFSFNPYGGNGFQSYFGVLINKKNDYFLVDSLNSGSHCGEPILKIDSISNLKIYASGLAYRHNDSCCCPTEPIKRQYVLKNNKVLMIK